MKDKLLVGAIVLGMVLIAWMLFNSPLGKAEATEITDGSNATSTYYASVSSAASGGCVLLKGVTNASIGNGRVSGILEKVVFTGLGRSGSTINLYDATTSDSTKRLGNPATTTITLAEIYGGHSASTSPMIFDVSFSTGLLMCVSGTPASSTITWK